MAKYFYDDGWEDILIAFPFNILEINTINSFAPTVDLQLTVCSAAVTAEIGKAAKRSFGICIKIDSGYGRTGLDKAQIEEIKAIIVEINKFEALKFSGLITHAGHTYHASGAKEVIEIHEDSCNRLHEIKSILLEENLVGDDEFILSIGDTPSCSLANNFQKINEIRPGNFVFYDCMQEQIGSCSSGEIAVVLACPVVEKNADRLEILVHGGAVHLSKEFILDDAGQQYFGKVVLFQEGSWSDPISGTWVGNLSQEHGIIKAEKHFFDHISPGMMLGILPVHSCLTMACMQKYILID
jgi:D-serine deaminase-like pyridoxal phosphate-dependent protein